MRATPTTTPGFDEGTTTEGDLNSIHLKFCKLQVWGGMWVPQIKFLSQFISCLEICVCPHILLKKMKKKMRGVAMVTTLSLHQQYTMVSALNVLLLTLNKALPGGRPRITRFVLMPISLWIKLNHASLLPLSVLTCSSLNVCYSMHS